jgi:hypothetical protein
MVEKKDVMNAVQSVIDSMGLGSVFDAELLKNIEQEASCSSHLLDKMLKSGVSLEDAANWYMSSGGVQGAFYNVQKGSAGFKANSVNSVKPKGAL